ncbi:lysophosphatidylcholine acyltransferase 2 isoform X1 [Scyliorhinus canicula]|uniref:lysophosphatidylcholine acyltransferase 2 isoform X1 n=2 Tax=Scyliorhinus canicula TaxID=7830 RepID=UPI0018F5BFE2|nr:lysophosphatidylcholine acyltransferase 2 isoform X1 [Scyliorhinus canicula]
MSDSCVVSGSRSRSRSIKRVFPIPRQHSLFQPPIINPFIYHIELSVTDKLKIALASVTLVPLRLLCIFFIALVAWPCAFLGRMCCPVCITQEPVPNWKRHVSRFVLRTLGRAFFFCVGFIQIKVTGKKATVAEAPILVVAPHSTFFDAVVNIVAEMPSIVSRAENADIPLFGCLLRCSQPVLVSRTETNSRKKTVEEITKRAQSKGKWPQLMIFPEGTCTNRTCLITFKSGAFIPGVPVQPVLIRYPNRLDTVTWTWQGHNAAMLMFLTLCQPYTNVEVEFLPVYVPSDEEKCDPLMFGNRVRSAMALALDVPITDHTFEDCRLMISAGELTLPMEAGLVEFTKISKKLNLKWDNVRAQLDRFSVIANKSKGGRIGIEEFANHLKLPVTPALKEVFSLFDRNGDGTIDFREYVIGLVVLCSPANTEETIQFAFKLFDLDEDGYITEEEFCSLLRSALGVHDLDVSKLFSDIDVSGSGTISYEVFREFALSHPEYAKLFTTYLELQRYKALQTKDDDDDLEPFKKAQSPTASEDSLSSSDKKAD